MEMRVEKKTSADSQPEYWNKTYYHMRIFYYTIRNLRFMITDPVTSSNLAILGKPDFRKTL